MINAGVWTEVNRLFTDADAAQRWSGEGIEWGLYRIPEAQLGVLGDAAGLDVLELGCGTAFLSAQLARAGARPVGVDLTPAQLRTARRCQQASGVHFPLVAADGEHVPLRDSSFDLVVSEHGASVWCEPGAWVGEAARLLRPGGRLVFLTCSVLVTLCVPDEGGSAGTRLLRPQRRDSRMEWPGGGVEHHPTHGEWIRILRSHGFVIEGMQEIYAPPGVATPQFYEIAEPAWARSWPVEELWSARLAD